MLVSYPPPRKRPVHAILRPLTVILRPFGRAQDIPFDYAQDRVWMPDPVAAERPELGSTI